MASGNDYYKEYKRKMRENRKANSKKWPVILLVVLFLAVGVSTVFILSHSNADKSGEQPRDTTTADIDNETDERVLVPQEDRPQEQKENSAASSAQSSNTTNQAPSSQSGQSSANNSRPQQDDNDAARQALLDQIAENEREKQRIAQEQAAVQLEQACNSIKTNMNSELRSAQTIYNNAVNNANCPSFGGCPAMTQAKNNYDSSVAGIKSRYLTQWQSTGCSGDLY